MEPAKPPLPCPWNLPFQPLAGSQTSILISESEVGVESTAILQNAGRDLKNAAAAAACAGFPGVGMVSAPAATDCAEVIFAWGMPTLARASQELAAGWPACANAL